MGNCSMPQGSVIGPLLFLAFINDMKQYSDKKKIIHYADDTTVSLSGKHLVGTIYLVNAELENIDRWLILNKLALNIDKTNYILFSTKNKNSNTSLKIRNVDVSRVSCAKFLGVTIDEFLNFNCHLNNVFKTASKSYGIICKLHDILPDFILRNIYMVLFDLFPYFRKIYMVLFPRCDGVGWRL